MGIFQSLVKKETKHIVRDLRTMIITLVMPLVLLLLFGFAISTEVNEVRIAAVVDNYDEEVRELLHKFEVNEYFRFKGVAGANEIDDLLRKSDIDAALYIRHDNGKPGYQIVADASNTVIAQSVTVYIQGVIGKSGANSPSPVLISTLYNPQMKSAYNFVPGIMGMIFILICAIMTSVSIVREKETGTMDLLLVSPIKPRTIIFGKLVPYFLLSCIILALMLTMSYTVLGLPLSANVISVILLSLLYVVLSLSLGLLVSTIANSQLTALIISAVVLMLPIIMLSGMIFPIDNMPVVLQGISCIIPARWYIEAMRKIMIQQLPITYITGNLIILSGMTVFMLAVAIKKFTSNQR